MAPSPGIAFGGVCTESHFVKCLETVAAVCRATRDDSFLRKVESKLAASNAKRSVESCEDAERLRKRARQDREDCHRRRQEAADLDRAAKRADVDGKVAVEKAKEANQQVKLKVLAAAAVQRLESDRRREEDTARKATRVWLQTKYPVELATAVRAWWARLPAKKKTVVDEALAHVYKTKQMLRNTEVPDLWDDDSTLLRPVGQVLVPGGPKVVGKCPLDFEWVLFEERWAAERGKVVDPSAMLQKLVNTCLPGSHLLFARRYTLPGLISICGGNVAKAFVYALMLLSKWLGPAVFPVGVHVWPPTREPVVAAAVAL